MATKVRILKLLQEIRGFAEITQRRPQPRQPGLFLVQLRSHVSHATSTRRKQQIITVDVLDRPDISHPVKITHLSVTPAAPVTPDTRVAVPVSQQA